MSHHNLELLWRHVFRALSLTESLPAFTPWWSGFVNSLCAVTLAMGERGLDWAVLCWRTNWTETCRGGACHVNHPTRVQLAPRVAVRLTSRALHVKQENPAELVTRHKHGKQPASESPRTLVDNGPLYSVTLEKCVELRKSPEQGNGITFTLHLISVSLSLGPSSPVDDSERAVIVGHCGDIFKGHPERQGKTNGTYGPITVLYTCFTNKLKIIALFLFCMLMRTLRNSRQDNNNFLTGIFVCEIWSTFNRISIIFILRWVSRHRSLSEPALKRVRFFFSILYSAAQVSFCH